MTTGLWVLAAAAAVALAFGTWRALTDGRFRRSAGRAASRQASVVETPETPTWAYVHAALPAADRGTRATLVQFSSAFCAPCRATRHVLAEVVGRTDGLTHVEVDAEAHLDLVRTLGILRTPTTLVLDASGREVARATGAPRRDQVEATLAAL